jgi:hypothetical protein
MAGVLGKLDQEVSEKLRKILPIADGKLDLSKVSPEMIQKFTGGTGIGGLQQLVGMFGGGNGGKKAAGGSWTDALAMLSAFGQMQGEGSAAPLQGLPAGHPLAGR